MKTDLGLLSWFVQLWVSYWTDFEPTQSGERKVWKCHVTVHVKRNSIFKNRWMDHMGGDQVLFPICGSVKTSIYRDKIFFLSQSLAVRYSHFDIWKLLRQCKFPCTSPCLLAVSTTHEIFGSFWIVVSNGRSWQRECEGRALSEFAVYKCPIDQALVHFGKI